MCAGLGCLPNLRARMSRTLSHHLVISLRIRASHNTLGVKASLQLWDAKTQHLCVVQMQVMEICCQAAGSILLLWWTGQSSLLPDRREAVLVGSVDCSLNRTEGC